MQNLHKINIKWNLLDPEMLEDDELFRIFNEWISESTEEVLIDVADYKHLDHGPTTILIGHDANYFLESVNETKGVSLRLKATTRGRFYQANKFNTLRKSQRMYQVRKPP